MTLTPQPTDVAALLREVQAIFRYKVLEKHLFFRLDCPAGLPLFLLDSLRLRQILLNLTGNAVKFTGEGGVTLSAGFTPSGGGRGTLAIRVRDTGIGIPEEAQQRIFEPFVQSDSARDTHVYGGTRPRAGDLPGGWPDACPERLCWRARSAKAAALRSSWRISNRPAGKSSGTAGRMLLRPPPGGSTGCFWSTMSR